MRFTISRSLELPWHCCSAAHEGQPVMECGIGRVPWTPLSPNFQLCLGAVQMARLPKGKRA